MSSVGFRVLVCLPFIQITAFTVLGVQLNHNCAAFLFLDLVQNLPGMSFPVLEIGLRNVINASNILQVYT